MEKTIQTYTELLNDGVRPEEPVPFFSNNKMFRRSIEPGSPSKGKLENQNHDKALIGLSARDLDPFITARHFNLCLHHRRDAAGVKERDELLLTCYPWFINIYNLLRVIMLCFHEAPENNVESLESLTFPGQNFPVKLHEKLPN